SLQVNYLSNALITVLLLPHLARGSEVISPSRIIFSSSVVHYFITRVSEADTPEVLSKLNSREHCIKSVMERRHSIFKRVQCLLYFSPENSPNGSTKTRVRSWLLSPGYCDTSLSHAATVTAIRRFLKRIVDYFIVRTPEMGSRTIIHAATTQGGKKQHGKYLTNYRVERESDYSLTQDGLGVQRRLWVGQFSVDF
ncbi:hypothetical protein DFH08DRAFT_715604, partial [Mycena albidolilacea]